jgi:hypothetical protein
MTDELSEKRHEISYRLRLSVRYHQRRVRFFDGWDLLAKGLSILAGTSAIGALWADEKHLAAWITAGITAVTTLSLVCGVAAKARLHADFARKYLELEASLVSSVNPTEQFLADIDGKVRMIEAQEPPPLGALVTLCQNELARQEGHEGHVVPLPVYQRWLAQFFDFQAPKPQT